jgi:hypothetical protein
VRGGTAQNRAAVAEVQDPWGGDRVIHSDAFIGLRLPEAQNLAAANGLRIEVLKDMIVDAMMDPRRVRVMLADGVITQAWRDSEPSEP